MDKHTHTAIQIAACFVIGSAAVLAFSPSAKAASPPCNDQVCTLDLGTLDLYCSWQPHTNCDLSGGGNDITCKPSSCEPQ